METILKRISTRNFSEEGLDKDKLEIVTKVINKENKGIFGNCFEFNLVDQKFMKKNKVKRIGTYGVITGNPSYIFATTDNSVKQIMDYGFVLENIVLDLTDSNIQSCWLGGTFSRKNLYKMFKLAQEDKIPAVIAIGNRGEKKSFVQNLMGSNYHSRKPFGELFFNNEPFKKLSQEQAEAFYEPLEAMRMAPSSMNDQPWRAIKEKDVIHFYCEMNNESKSKYVDMGIGLSHFQRLCAKNNIHGRWDVFDNANINNMKYIISYTAD